MTYKLWTDKIVMGQVGFSEIRPKELVVFDDSLSKLF